MNFSHPGEFASFPFFSIGFPSFEDDRLVPPMSIINSLQIFSLLSSLRRAEFWT